MMHNDWAAEQSLRCIARTRTLGLHFFGHMLGITVGSSSSESAVVRSDPPARAGEMAQSTPVAVAATADLAMSLAIRRRLQNAARLGTTSMTIQFVRRRFSGGAVATAQFAGANEDSTSAHATCVVHDPDGAVAAIADAWFVVLPLPAGRALPRQRWELEERVPSATVTHADLTERERASFEAVARASREAHVDGKAVSEALLGLRWDSAPGLDHVRGSARPGPELTNRVGHVQGGALFGMAVAAAERTARSAERLVMGHLQYLRAAHEAPMQLEATVSRRGRRASFVEVGLSDEKRQLVEGLFTFDSQMP